MKNLVKIAAFIVLIVLGGTCIAQCNSRCQAAFAFVVSHEDASLSGVVAPDTNHSVARFGVNSNAHPQAIRDGYYTMNKKAALRYAERLFYRGYWKPMHGDEILVNSLAFKLADLSYNLGPIRATILLQRALNAEAGFTFLNEKGVFGPQTLDAVYSEPANLTTTMVEVQALRYYTRLVKQCPAMKKWQRIWTARLAEKVIDFEDIPPMTFESLAMMIEQPAPPFFIYDFLPKKLE